MIAAISGVVLGCFLGTAWAAFSGTTSNGPNNFSVVAADTTDPTIARATVAKTAAGSAAGTVRQGATYYVYAEVTDAGSGVNTVTTNTSSFDTGVTAQSLSTSGGPWTVGGQSYNYRSTGTLTANTGLTTGNTYAYTITATDVATNQAGPTSFNATIETYNSVITGTAGLVSHWRLGETAPTVVDDTMTGSAGTTLQSHTGETGATWTKHSLSNQDAVISDANRVRKNGSGLALYHASGTPSSANYSVEADIHVKSLLANDRIGVTGRWDTANANGTFYLARYDVPTATWQLIKITNGSGALLGSFAQTLTAGSTYALRLEMTGTAIKLFVNGVERISVSDASISATGKGGIMFGDSTSANVTNTTGLHLDNFTILGAAPTTATDGPGTNDGTYTNSPTLGVPGGLAGDSNTAVQFDGVSDYVTVARQISGNFSIEYFFESTQGIGVTSNWADGAGMVDANTSGIVNDFGTSLRSDGRVVAGVGNPNTSIVSTTGGFNDGQMHHVVFTRTQSSGALALYVDGNPQGTATGGTQALTATANINFGRIQSGGAFHLAGTLDEVAIYNQVLSAATVLDHYRAGAGTG